MFAHCWVSALALLGEVVLLQACTGPSHLRVNDTAKAPAPQVIAPLIAPPQHAEPFTSNTALSTLPPTAPKATENLLRLAATEINVSSTSSGTGNFPEDLVDEDLTTAWRSAAGDLSPTIRIKLPEDVQVERIELTAGYTKSSNTRDWFTQHYRTSEVAVRRNGQELGRFALDPERRDLQIVPITGGGGIYELQVTNANPGSRPQWRDIALSELRVMGRAGTATLAEGPPRVEVGSTTHARAQELETRIQNWTVEANAFSPTLAALCAQAVARIRDSLPTPDSATTRGRAKCTPSRRRQALVSDSTYLDLNWVQIYDGKSRDTWLALRLSRGYTWLRFGPDVEAPGVPADPDKFHPTELASVRIENGHLLLILNELVEYGTGDKEVRVGAMWCRDDSATLSCRLQDPTRGQALGYFHIDKAGRIHPHDF